MVNLKALPVIGHYHLRRNLTVRVGTLALLFSPEPVILLWRDAIPPLQGCLAAVTPRCLRMILQPGAASVGSRVFPRPDDLIARRAKPSCAMPAPWVPAGYLALA